MEQALDESGWHSFKQRQLNQLPAQIARHQHGLLYRAVCRWRSEQARLAVDGKGHVTLYIGTQNNGQGHETAFRQIIQERLGVDFTDISIVRATRPDSKRRRHHGVPLSAGRGAAVSTASEKLIESAKLEAADLLEASVADIDFEHGAFRLSEPIATPVSRRFACRPQRAMN